MPSHPTPLAGAAVAPADADVGAPAAHDDVERALLAQLHFASGGWHDGLAACAGGASRGLRLIEARGHFGMGQRAAALHVLEQLLAERPGDALVLYHKAQFLAQSGRPREAVAALAGLIASVPDFPGALTALATLVFPGPSYRDVLGRLHEVLRPPSYLEIGVEHGTSPGAGRSQPPGRRGRSRAQAADSSVAGRGAALPHDERRLLRATHARRRVRG